MGRAGFPIWEKCCVIPSGTGEGINVRNHVANCERDRFKEGRRSDRRQSANLFGERVEPCVTLVANNIVGDAGISGECVSRSGGVKS